MSGESFGYVFRMGDTAFEGKIGEGYMVYFNPLPGTLAELKQRYRQLSFKHHPDVGGSEDAMKIINSEYTALFHELKSTYINTDAEQSSADIKETPEHMIVLMNRMLKAQRWVDAAQEEYYEAEYVFQSMDEGELEAVWELCYAAAQKYIISLLVFRNISVPGNTSLLDLVTLCETKGKIPLSFMYTKCSALLEKNMHENEYTGSFIEKEDAKYILKSTERIDYFVTSYYHEILNRNIEKTAYLEKQYYLQQKTNEQD
ncbi:MAG: HEPN domain-containing protein [Clostridia bacterium]|nr:HEPN domain-containing protein [Clostridia bacterium]